MRKVITLLLFCIFSSHVFSQFNACSQWTWVKGGPGATDPLYETKGQGSTSNRPGARDGQLSWNDASGKFYLYGGVGYANSGTFGLLGDLWRFDPAVNQWTWIHGSSTSNPTPIYGTKGVSSSMNTPGGRSFGAVWQGPNATIWIYGGDGTSTSGRGFFNDLWQYNTSTNQWTWISGSTSINQPSYYTTLGVSGLENTPGGRTGSSTWIDGSGNLWLFGGYDINGTPYNDLWKYDFIIGKWTAVQAVNSGFSATQPARRYHAAEWKDVQGNLWLFGGYGTASGNGSFGDVWKYSIGTNQWMLIKGNSALHPPAEYGTQGVATPVTTPGGRYSGVSWSDGNNKFWFFGGYKEMNNEGPYNDLWQYDPVQNTWTWIKGDKVPYATSVYGTKGLPYPSLS